MMYVITGINRLTGEREAVTRPYALDVALELRVRLNARQNCRSTYKGLKVEES